MRPSKKRSLSSKFILDLEQRTHRNQEFIQWINRKQVDLQSNLAVSSKKYKFSPYIFTLTAGKSQRHQFIRGSSLEFKNRRRLLFWPELSIFVKIFVIYLARSSPFIDRSRGAHQQGMSRALEDITARTEVCTRTKSLKDFAKFRKFWKLFASKITNIFHKHFCESENYTKCETICFSISFLIF